MTAFRPADSREGGAGDAVATATAPGRGPRAHRAPLSRDSWGGHQDAPRYLYVNMFVNSCTVFLGGAGGGLEIANRIICCHPQMADIRPHV